MRSESCEALTVESRSEHAKQRMLSLPGEPLLYADWLRPVFMHYEVDAQKLQPSVPFELDLRDGRAYVSLVAFTMRGLRLARGGRWTSWLFAPIATHELLNVRTYVRHRTESGIYFLSEWIPNRLSVLLGPRTFGLPYRHGRLEYEHIHEEGSLSGKVSAGSTNLSYAMRPNWNGGLTPCPVGSLSEFLLERYTAFTSYGSRRKFFRVWHKPWLQMEIDPQVRNDSLLRANFRWFAQAELVAANYSPGAHDVWMGRPRRIK